MHRYNFYNIYCVSKISVLLQFLAYFFLYIFKINIFLIRIYTWANNSIYNIILYNIYELLFKRNNFIYLKIMICSRERISLIRIQLFRNVRASKHMFYIAQELLLRHSNLNHFFFFFSSVHLSTDVVKRLDSENRFEFGVNCT